MIKTRRRRPKRRRKAISLDISPIVLVGRQTIQGYGTEGFRVNGELYKTSILVSRELTVCWPVNSVGDITVESVNRLLPLVPSLLIVGCGAKFTMEPEKLRFNLKRLGTALEWMDTGAACRTFNILAAEDRDAVAALIATG